MLNDGFFAFALRGVFRLAIDQATPDVAQDLLTWALTFRGGVYVRRTVSRQTGHVLEKHRHTNELQRDCKKVVHVIALVNVVLYLR